MALPGLLLSTGRFDEAKSVLTTFAQAADEGMLPNRFDDYTNNEFDPNTWNLYIHKNDIPEFSSWIILPLFLIAILVAVIIKKRVFPFKMEK